MNDEGQISRLSGVEIRVAANGYIVRSCGRDDPLFQSVPYVFSDWTSLVDWMLTKLETHENRELV